MRRYLVIVVFFVLTSVAFAAEELSPLQKDLVRAPRRRAPSWWR